MSTIVDKRPDADHDATHELLDIIAEEVSDVDRAANRHRYLAIKRDEATPGAELRQDNEGNWATVHKNTALEADPESDPSGAPADPSSSDAVPPNTAPVTKQALVMPQAAKAGLLKWVKDAQQRLGAVVTSIEAAETTDAASDHPTPDAVARELMAVAKLLVGALAKFPAPVTAQMGTTTEAKDADKLPINKAGTKLAAKRRAQLQSVIELLQKLLEEVMPLKSALDDATPGRRSLDLNKANVGAGVQPDPGATPDANTALAAVPGLADVLKQLSDLNAKVHSQDALITKLRTSTGLPASLPVERTGRRAATPVEVAWPLDMNRPIDRDQIAKEISFFDD